MWRQASVVILLFAFIASIFCREFILLDYYSNTAAYAKNCENKLRPQMHCNGKCQMMKKLQQQENNEQNNPERKSENKNQVLSSKSFFGTITLILFPRNTCFASVYHTGKPVDISYTLLRPPSAA